MARFVTFSYDAFWYPVWYVLLTLYVAFCCARMVLFGTLRYATLCDVKWRFVAARGYIP